MPSWIRIRIASESGSGSRDSIEIRIQSRSRALGIRMYLESGALAVEPGGEALEVRHFPEVVLVQVLPQVCALHECLYEVQPLVYLVRLCT